MMSNAKEQGEKKKMYEGGAVKEEDEDASGEVKKTLSWEHSLAEGNEKSKECPVRGAR